MQTDILTTHSLVAEVLLHQQATGKALIQQTMETDIGISTTAQTRHQVRLQTAMQDLLCKVLTILHLEENIQLHTVEMVEACLLARQLHMHTDLTQFQVHIQQEPDIHSTTIIAATDLITIQVAQLPHQALHQTELLLLNGQSTHTH